MSRKDEQMLKNCLENYERYLTVSGEGNELEKIFIQFCQGITNETPERAFKRMAKSFVGYYGRKPTNDC